MVIPASRPPGGPQVPSSNPSTSNKRGHPRRRANWSVRSMSYGTSRPGTSSPLPRRCRANYRGLWSPRERSRWCSRWLFFGGATAGTTLIETRGTAIRSAAEAAMLPIWVVRRRPPRTEAPGEETRETTAARLGNKVREETAARGAERPLEPAACGMMVERLKLVAMLEPQSVRLRVRLGPSLRSLCAGHVLSSAEQRMPPGPRRRRVQPIKPVIACRLRGASIRAGHNGSFRTLLSTWRRARLIRPTTPIAEMATEVVVRLQRLVGQPSRYCHVFPGCT